jgi:penicillin-binding protein 1A
MSRPRSAYPNRPPLPRLPRDHSVGTGRLRRFLIAASLFIVLIVAVIAIAIVLAFETLQLPPTAPMAQASVITDASGNQLATFNAGENRTPVQLGQVPPVVIQAVIDTEDHDFYKHHGVDPRGTARAFVDDLRGQGGLQGGSTITQQYVKQVYVGSERTVWRKFKEAVLAIKLERRESKDEILQNYLNTIYFGRGAYGVEAASKAYFNEDVSKLDLQDASYLAGLIRGPELADVTKDPQVATQRRDLTLSSMVKYGAITQQQADQVKAIPLASYVTKTSTPSSDKVSGDKGDEYFVAYVKSVLIQRFGEQVVESGGLHVQTTLDPSLQAKAYTSVYGFLKPNEPSGALVSIDSNGYIKAMVGGRDYSQSQVNLATGAGGSGRQAGSTFKAFELAAATNDDICYKDTFSGPSSMVIPGWDSEDKPVTNFGNESFGRISLVDATVNSVNTVYAQLVMQDGVGNLIDTARAAGITSDMPNQPSLVLGTASVTPLDMADAYLTFSQQGEHVDPNPILEVKDSSGQILEKSHRSSQRVIPENTANVVNYALQQVVNRGTGTAAQIGKPLAGKTGTTENEGDAWFVGYTPTLSTAVWMGYPEGSSHAMTNVRGIAVTGGTFPAQIFANYMKYATRNAPATGFAAPDDCSASRGDDSSTTSSTDTSLTEPELLTIPPTTFTVPHPTTTVISVPPNRPLDDNSSNRRRQEALDTGSRLAGDP